MIEEDLPGKVVHCQRHEYDVYIGRWNPKIPIQSKWANPFKIGPDGNRKEVLKKYEIWIRQQPELMASLHELKGKRLACWCYPSFCHGTILLRLLKEQLESENKKE